MNIGRESETMEFKESISQLDKGLKSLSAMLNRHNRGTVYLGVDDSGDVIGMDIGKDTLENIRNLVRSRIQPQILPEVTEHFSDDGRRFITIHASGYDTPYSYDGRYFIRNVSSDESAGPEIVTQLVLARGADPLKDRTSDVQDLTFDLLLTIMSSRGLHPKVESGFFRSHAMMDGYGAFNLTAYLLSDQNNIPIQVVRFNGCDRSSMSDRTDFGGRSIIVSMRAVLDHIASYMVTEVDLSKGERVEVHLFDFESFREAWINACVHNAWWMMLPPSVMVFDDRIEVVSYGTVPFPMSLESFFEGDSRPVNKALFSMFSLLGMTEQSGHGVPTIVRSYGREAFDISDNGVTVTIPFAFEPDYVSARKETSINGLELDGKRRMVIEYLSRNPDAKLSEAAEYAGMSLSNVKKTVSGFKAEGILRNDGTNRRSRWVVLRSRPVAWIVRFIVRPTANRSD